MLAAMDRVWSDRSRVGYHIEHLVLRLEDMQVLSSADCRWKCARSLDCGMLWVELSHSESERADEW